MPNVNDLKQSKYLTKEDVGRGVLLTVKGYQKVNVALETQAPEMKYVLSFLEHEKPLVLNQTNGIKISEIAGSEDFDDWIGIKVVLFNDPTIAFAGKITGGIRVRAPRNQAAPAVNPPAEDDKLPF
jgi:hypothetical protein